MDQTWGEYEAAIASGRAQPPPHPIFYEGDPLPGRLQNVHTIVPAMDQMLHEPRINHVVSLLLGAKAKPFQTIIGHKATDQKEHSDSIHLTTYPAGYLAATWLAYEDIDPNSGPLVYYPAATSCPTCFRRTWASLRRSATIPATTRTTSPRSSTGSPSMA
jgi:hypothetical protein